MALNAFGIEVGANGDTLTTTSFGCSAVVSTGTSTFQVSTAQSAHGTRSAYIVASSTSGGAYAQYDLGSTTEIALRKYMRWTALPSADTGIIWLGNGSSQRLHVEVTTTGAMRVRDDANAARWNGAVTTSVGTVSTGTWIRYQLEATMSATVGTFRLRAYSLDSTTPLTNMDSGAMTGQNTGPDAWTTLRVGVKTSTGTNTGTAYLDDIAFDPATSTAIGPYTEVLATPTLTVDDFSDPTTVGGSDGSITISWGAIAGATSYDAYIAPGPDPDPGDFTLVEAGVTSPYEFDGLEDGLWAPGIQAKA